MTEPPAPAQAATSSAASAAALRAVAAWAASRPGTPVCAAFLRPLEHDDDSPAHRDLDLLVFDNSDELCVERVSAGPAHAPTLDLMRLPAALLQQPERLAGFGLVTHRLLGSVLAFDVQGQGAVAQARAQALCWQGPSQRARLASFLEMAYLTVREVGVTRDFPALALFWLHMTHAACIAALCDAARQFCPNVYTRPLRYLGCIDAAIGAELAAQMPGRLRLDRDPAALQAPLRALHAHVRAHCPEPDWPASIGSSTRAEYRYWLASAELDERLDSAAAMARHGNPAGAVFYLRYCAYSLARIAMIHQRVAEGSRLALSFIRPEREVGPDLRAHHPAVLGWLDTMLGGTDGADAALQEALASMGLLRSRVLEVLARQGHQWSALALWQPHRAAR